MSSSSNQSQVIFFEGFELDTGRRRLLRDGQAWPLNAKAFDLLAYLAANAGRVVSKDEIMDAVWPDQFVEEANLKVQISALRKALGESKDEHRFLVTIPGQGYKFVADIQSGDRELVIETHRISRLVVDEVLEAPAAAHRPGAFSRRLPGLATLVTLGLFAVLLGAGFGIYRYFRAGLVLVPFAKVKLTRLTNSGNVGGAAVSPDGKYLAYVLGERDGNSLWTQQIGTANTYRLLPTVKAQVYNLTFTPDGSQVYYNLFEDGQSDPQFYRVAALGGVSEKIPNVIASYLAFSPDGKRIAYAQSHSAAGQNYLVVADGDGTNQRRLAVKKHPNTFETNVPVVAWAPDGETIACLVNHFDADASYSEIVGISTRDGSERPLSGQRWYDVFGIEWLRSGGGLLISSSDSVSGRNQIRFLSYPQGEARQVTNDLNQYNLVSATADGRAFVTLQTNTVNGIVLGELGADAHEFKELVSETGGLFPIAWLPDGRIAYRSSKDGVSNLWTMAADGSNRRQLTTGAQVDSRGLCSSPDGKYLVFGSWRGGRSNIWRAEVDTGNVTQLTYGDVDVYPSCSPDDRTVVYQRGLHSEQRLWKVPLAGGEPIQLTDFIAKWNAVSNVGSRVSYFFMADSKWRIGIVSSDGGAMQQRLDVPPNLRESATEWSPDDRSLFYIDTVGNVGNIWSLPLNGGEAKPVTNFTSHSIENFSLSPDGKRLAIARSVTISDVVLVTNDTSPQ